MAVWQENLQRLLSQKEVLILHSNIRDTAYIKKDGNLVPGLTPLLREAGKALNFQRSIFWGVAFDSEKKGHTPVWSLERIESLDGGSPPEARTAGSQDRELVVLSRWLKEEVRDITRKTLFVIYYIDKLTPYSNRGIYPRDIAQLITLVQKIIENIAENNRLIMVALQDTMIPLDYYTNSPRVAVLEIPLPDKEERTLYFSRQLANRDLSGEQIDFLGNITDGLYVRDLENILRDVVEAQASGLELSSTALRKRVNRYRIGTDEDPWAGLPLASPPKGLIDCAEAWFKERVIGQDHAVIEVVRAIKKARAGVVGLASGQAGKPRAVFFFAGPTGVGKTFLAKKLAEYLFDTEEAFARFDMSEFKEEHTVSKLIGAPPGYVGYEMGGELTNAVKTRPFSVILFDEIEKAHPKIMDIFLQILDDGRLTDSRGQTVFFTESVIIFTSNLGTRTTDSRGHEITEKACLEKLLTLPKTGERACQVREHFVTAVQDFFIYEISRPELLNRIGNHIFAFNHIDNTEVMERIIASKLRDIAINFRDKFSHLRHRLNFVETVATHFLKHYQASIERFGGRGLVNAIDDELGYILVDQMLWAEKNGPTGQTFIVQVNDQGELRCHRES